MREYLCHISRIFLGLIFTLSGLIKLNDPLGFSFKLEEYFSPSVFDLPIFVSWSLGLALFISITEVVLGVSVLIGFCFKWTFRTLLLMLIFFGFLTFYSAYFNKVTDCGCFGDAIKLTPWQSFVKDLLLLLVTLVIIWNRKFMSSLFSNKTNKVIMMISLISCLFFGHYVLNHLPVVDFRAYKIGNNIHEKMKIPEGASKDVFEYSWKINQNDKDTVIKNTGDYPEIEGEFINVETKLVRKGYVPPIHDFTMQKEGVDATAQMMSEPLLMIITSYDISTSSQEGWQRISKIIDTARQKKYKVIALSASEFSQEEKLSEKYHLGVDFYHADNTTIKTMVRSNPSVLLLQKGSIVDKRHHNDVDLLNF